jgi:hypothetical protein
MAKHENELTPEAKAFLEKWSSWFILQKNGKELKEAMQKELSKIMKECFVWGQISRAVKHSSGKVDKSMQFTFEQWIKTTNEK